MIKTNISIIVLCFVVSFTYGQNNPENTKDFTQELVYKIVDNDTLKLQIYNPINFDVDKKYPTIVFYFGGGWNSGSISQFKDQALYFSSRGMITVLVDYRVKNRHKTSPFESVKDAKSSIRFLRANAKKFNIDTTKVVASGGSAGGHLAAATTLLEGINETTDDLSISSKVNALVLFNPVIDNSKEGYGHERIGERYIEFSPIHNIKKGNPPTIFFLGSKDKLIPVSTAYKYQEKMKAVGSRCDVFIYENQPHGFFNKWKEEGEKYFKKTVDETDLFLQSLGFISKKIIEK